MNQGDRYAKKLCISCGREIWVKQVYNTHYSDWEDIEPWICQECENRSCKEWTQKK